MCGDRIGARPLGGGAQTMGGQVMPEWSQLAIVVAALLVWTLLLKTFPDFVAGAVIKVVERRQNERLEQLKSELALAGSTKIEELKAELGATYSTLKSSMDFLAAGHSELRSKTIASSELLDVTP